MLSLTSPSARIIVDIRKICLNCLNLCCCRCGSINGLHLPYEAVRLVISLRRPALRLLSRRPLPCRRPRAFPVNCRLNNLLDDSRADLSFVTLPSHRFDSGRCYRSDTHKRKQRARDNNKIKTAENSIKLTLVSIPQISVSVPISERTHCRAEPERRQNAALNSRAIDPLNSI